MDENKPIDSARDKPTTLDSARTIMGPNFISLEEAATVFPCDFSDLLQLQSIPYSKGLLYQLSEPECPFVLVPGIPFVHRGKTRPLTIATMRDIFSNTPGLFAETIEFYQPDYQFIHNHICLPQWYLLSKNPKNLPDVRKLLINMEMFQGDYVIERAVVYIYTWLLFYNLRKESIFTGDWVITGDDFSPHVPTNHACLFFNENKISMCRWSKRYDWKPGIAPFIKHDLT